MLIRLVGSRRILVLAQKSGMLHGVDPDHPTGFHGGGDPWSDCFDSTGCFDSERRLEHDSSPAPQPKVAAALRINYG